MADNKPTVNAYGMLGGVNQKASEYSVGLVQFLNIRNMDFDVPNALSKRPGSTQAITANTSGPLNSLFEFQRLDGASWIVTGSDTAMFFRDASSALNLLSPTWTNGQSTDMLTFVNKLWMCNGQKYESWNGVGATNGATALPVGQYCPLGLGLSAPTFGGQGATSFLAGTYRHQIYQGPGTTLAIAKTAVFVAYSYLKVDGNYGPINFYESAKNVLRFAANTSGDDILGLNASFIVTGVTVPSNQGITAVALWVAFDGYAFNGGSQLSGVSLGLANFRSVSTGYADVTLRPEASQLTIDDNFRLYTLVPSASLTGGTYGLFFTSYPTWVADYTNNGVNSTLLPVAGRPVGSFSLSSFCWFNTNTPKYIDINQNSMFMSGFSNAPSVMWFSDVGDPESIEPEYNFEVRTNDGDVIRGHKTYNNMTIVCKENSFHKVLGDSPENFELVELSTEYGCLSNQTMIEYKEKLLFLDKKGIVEYNGASWDVISTPVEDIFRQMNLSAARDKACAVHHVYRNQVWFGIPVGSSTVNNVTVVYDYLIGGWTFFDGFNPASFGFAQGPLPRPTVWRGDYSGLLHYHSETFYGDNGHGITCLAYTPWEHSKENETWIWRRFFLDVATVTGLTGLITGNLYSSYNTSTVLATFSMFQDQFQSRAEIGLPGKSAACEFAHYSASLPLLINGYSWARRFLRNV